MATGGGTPCFYDNMDCMNNSGVTVYLFHPPASLFHRLINAKKSRPLLVGKSEEELKQYLSETLKVRENYYNKAQLIVDACNTRPEQILSLLNTMSP